MERDTFSSDDEAYIDYEEYEGAQPDELEEAALLPEPATQLSMPLVLAGATGALLALGLLLFMLLQSNSAAGGTTTSPAPGDIVIGNTTVITGQLVDTNIERPQTGYLAPDFTVAGLESGTVKLSSYRGHKAVWLNFWASWCQPCKVEMPEMETIYRQYKDRDVEIIGIGVLDDAGQLSKFVADNGFSWTFGVDHQRIAFPRYFSGSVPTHAFIKKDGRISSIVIGSLPRSMMEAEVEKMLK